MSRKISVILTIAALIIFSRSELWADTIYFRNGKSVEGRVKSYTRKKAVIETSFGDIECAREQILKIKPGKKDEVAQAIERRYEQYGPQEVPISVSADSKSASVEVMLNNSVKAVLDVDTGASIIVLSRKIGEALGVNLADKKKGITSLQLAGGKNVNAKVIILDSVMVGDVEAKDIVAAVLLEEYGDKNINDGLLGMSFLNKFNMKIDLQKRKMTLIKTD